MAFFVTIMTLTSCVWNGALFTMPSTSDENL